MVSRLGPVCVGLVIVLLASVAPARAAGTAKPDIVSCDLRIQPDFLQKRLSLRAVLTIDNPVLASTFAFRLNDRYQTVRAADERGPAAIRRNGNSIEVTIQTPTPRVRLTFELEGAPGTSRGEDRPVVDDSSLFLLWSDDFYPMDVADWATTTTTVVLPARFKVVAPGRLVSERTRNGLREHVFTTRNPVSGVSVFADTDWVRSERRSGNLVFETYLHPASQRFADRILKTSTQVVSFFSETFCAYPFDNFRFVTIRGTGARRAFPGMVGYSPEYLETEMARTGHDAHETALLWWTYTTRGSDGSHNFQWTEGLGDYAEFLYDERFGKPLPGIFWWFRDRYMALDPAQEPAWDDIPGSLQEVEHGKYPWLMHLLRYRMGDRAFRLGMKRLFAAYRFREFSMDDFVRTLESAGGQRLDWWRSEWLERQGVPSFAMHASASPASRGYRVDVTVEQAGAVHHLPLQVEIVTAAGRSLHTIELSDKTTRAVFDVPARPVQVILDPAGWVIARYLPGSVLTVRDRADATARLDAATSPDGGLADRAMRLAAPWLPGGRAFAPPDTTGSTSGATDPTVLAHDYHCTIRAKLLRYSLADVAPEHASLVRLLDEIHAEGVADRIDKARWLNTGGADAMSGQALRYVEMVKRAPDAIRLMDRVLAEMAERPAAIDALAADLERSLPMAGGAPAGFYMAGVIDQQLGRARLVEHIGNPFRFFALYNEAAQKAGTSPAFSAPALRLLRSLERRYVPLADKGVKLGIRVM